MEGASSLRSSSADRGHCGDCRARGGWGVRGAGRGIGDHSPSFTLEGCWERAAASTSAWLDPDALSLSPPEAPECPVFPLLTGRLPDREEDWPRAVQRGIQGHLPAGQEDSGPEEGAGEPVNPWGHNCIAGADYCI